MVIYDIFVYNRRRIYLNIIISNSGDVPIYQQIVNQLKDAILRGELVEGDLLPSIRTLAKELRISVITTKRAYDDLEQEGYVVSVSGKGSYVAERNAELLHESRLSIVEGKLEDAVKTAKSLDIKRPDVFRLLELLYEEEEQ